MKRCWKCKKTLAIELFGSNRSRPDGKNVTCRECVRAISKARSAYHDQWRAKNPEKFNAGCRRWAEANKSRSKEIKDASYQKHREKRLESKRTYYLNNKEKYRAWDKLVDPNIRRGVKNRRRARIEGNGFVKYNPAEIFARDGHSCIYCDAPALHLDHLIPIARGGPDTPDNVAAACARCNKRKGKKTPSEFLRIWARAAA